MNNNKIEEIVKNNLEELNYELDVCEEGLELKVWDKSKSLENDEVLDIVESCLYEIKDSLEEDLKDRFESEIMSDDWFSGFNNVEEEDLNVFCKNVLDFSFYI